MVVASTLDGVLACFLAGVVKGERIRRLPDRPPQKEDQEDFHLRAGTSHPQEIACDGLANKNVRRRE